MKSAFQWSIQTQYFLSVRAARVQLGVGVFYNVKGRWDILALETDQEQPAAILASHKHELVGKSFPTLEKAQRRAERFAARWLKAHQGAQSLDDAGPCACGPIAKRKASPKAREGLKKPFNDRALVRAARVRAKKKPNRARR